MQRDVIEKKLINDLRPDTLQLKEWWLNLIQKSIVNGWNWKKKNSINK